MSTANVPRRRERISVETLVEMGRLRLARGLRDGEVVAYCREQFGAVSPAQISEEQGQRVLRWLAGLPMPGSQTRMEGV